MPVDRIADSPFGQVPPEVLASIGSLFGLDAVPRLFETRDGRLGTS